MPQLPRSIWLIIIGVALLLVGLCGIASYAVLRARTRQRVAVWPATWILALVVAGVVPWLVVSLTQIRISVNIEGIIPLIGWLIVALSAFALLVLLPLVALLSAGVWLIARRRPR